MWPPALNTASNSAELGRSYRPVRHRAILPVWKVCMKRLVARSNAGAVYAAVPADKARHQWRWYASHYGAASCSLTVVQCPRDDHLANARVAPLPLLPLPSSVTDRCLTVAAVFGCPTKSFAVASASPPTVEMSSMLVSVHRSGYLQSARACPLGLHRRRAATTSAVTASQRSSNA